MPENHSFLGLVDTIYNPKTTDERFKTSGATCHLIDDLAVPVGSLLLRVNPACIRHPA